ncbi:MAG: helix-turn-helix domain-containing protein [Massilioclostridium sp.]|nr:helix-turn-helix domain-containing protein [Massilioclostridium sp.]
MEPSVYKVEDIMKILSIGKNSAYNLIKQNLFPVIRVKKSIRIPKDPFLEWVRKGSCETR